MPDHAAPPSPRSRLDLGVGITAPAGMSDLWPEIADLVDVIELVDLDHDHAWVRTAGRRVITHAVGSPVGGQLEPDPRDVALAAARTRAMGAVHTSEHVGFTRAVSNDAFVESDELIPPRQTWATIEAAIAQIREYQRHLTMPMLIEGGVNHLRLDRDELDDGTFLAEIVERADCGLLLDLQSLLANERNGRYPVEQVLRSLPLERVMELHVSGAAGGPCDQTVLSVLATTLPMLPNLRTVIFDVDATSLPRMSAAVVRRQLDLLHEIVDFASLRPVSCPPRRRTTWIGAGASTISEADWQRQAIAYVSGRSDRPPTDDPGFATLRAAATREGGQPERSTPWMRAESAAFRRWVGAADGGRLAS